MTNLLQDNVTCLWSTNNIFKKNNTYETIESNNKTLSRAKIHYIVEVQSTVFHGKNKYNNFSRSCYNFEFHKFIQKNLFILPAFYANQTK